MRVRLPTALLVLTVVALAGRPSVHAIQATAPAASQAPDPNSWPREARGAQTTVLMYQPQVERFTLNEIEARAAVQVTETGKEPVFGAVWIAAKVDVDRDTRLVSFRDIRIPRVRFVDATDEEKAALARFLEREMPRWEVQIDLDRLVPLLDLAEHDDPAAGGLKHDAPRIIVASEPTTLVVLDGPPRRSAMTTPKDAQSAKLERVVNTAALLVYEPRSKTYYLAGGGDLWYSATDATGPYAVAARVPAAIAALAPKASSDDQSSAKPPQLVIATEPTELIVVTGPPQYAPVGDVNLLAVSNADTDILVTMAARAHYVLLSGRWYVSRNELKGPWSFVPPDELPAEFGRIPEGSEHAHVRAHVPGTVEAEEALLDNVIPETQAIRRDDHSLKVEYDGAPQFKEVESGALQYAVNTPQAVFKLGSRYYACHQGVWYESATATGPWSVSTAVPKEIYALPPSNPHYNVTYVKVYDVTPQVVHVGYTPGYLGSYPYRGCVVYGTGWYYPGWYGAVYYPRPATWGFRAVYNPYYGWGFGIGWSSGPLTVSIGFGGPMWGYPGYWGPWGYRPYYPPYRPPYYPGYRPPYYPGYRPPGYPGYRPPVVLPSPGTPVQLPAGRPGTTRPSDRDIYQRPGNVDRNRPAPAAGDRVRPVPATRPDDVFSSPAGDVFRRTPSGGWDQREGGTWRPSPGDAGRGGAPSTPTTRPAAPGAGAPTTRPGGPTTRPGSGGLNGDFGARQRGQSRSGAAPRRAPRGGRGR
jgi:hypothetical protein